METIVNQSSDVAWSAPALIIAVLATAVSLTSLMLLHVLSPEFAPSWRMVSEYANGRYPWLLTIVFGAWAISSFALVLGLWPLSASTIGKAGLAFLFIAGIGQMMGGIFDINHKLHGPAAMIGIPGLCIAAVLLTITLARRDGLIAPPIWSAHSIWMSFALMLAAMAVFMTALKSAGVDLPGQAGSLRELPPGVHGYVGWANRFLFASSFLWVILTSVAKLKQNAVQTITD